MELRNGCACILYHRGKGKVLLQLRTKEEGLFFPGFWSIFGGGLDEGERPEACILRELKEEIRFRPEHIMYWKETPYKEFIFHIFIGLIDLEKEEIALREGEDMGYFSEEEIDKMDIAFDYKQYLLEFFEKREELLLELSQKVVS